MPSKTTRKRPERASVIANRFLQATEWKPEPKPKAKPLKPATMASLRKELEDLKQRHTDLIRLGSGHEVRIRTLLDDRKRHERQIKRLGAKATRNAKEAQKWKDEWRSMLSDKNEAARSLHDMVPKADYEASEQRVKALRTELCEVRDMHRKLVTEYNAKLVDLERLKAGLETLKVNPGDAVVPARVAVDLQSVGNELLEAQQTIRVQQIVIDNREREIEKLKAELAETGKLKQSPALEEAERTIRNQLARIRSQEGKLQQMEKSERSIIQASSEIDAKSRFNRRTAEIYFQKLEAAEEELAARATEIRNLQAVLKNNA